MSRDIPVIFSPVMVKAHLDDLKRMTRRLGERPRYTCAICGENRRAEGVCRHCGGEALLEDTIPSPWTKVKSGDRLWVREEWRVSKKWDAIKPADITPRVMSVMFTAGGSIANTSTGAWAPDRSWPAEGQFPDWAGRRRASMHMPRWASRLTLLVTATKTERLHDISDHDCFAEGLQPWGGLDEDGRIFINPVKPTEGGPGKWAFGELWKHLHGPESWDANPLVVAISYSVVKANIDALEAKAA